MTRFAKITDWLDDGDLDAPVNKARYDDFVRRRTYPTPPAAQPLDS